MKEPSADEVREIDGMIRTGTGIPESCLTSSDWTNEFLCTISVIHDIISHHPCVQPGILHVG